jgi:hypothetical protein
MKESRGLKEIHEIMEGIYEEEKGLTAQERIGRIREESNAFLLEQNINLRRVKPRDATHTGSAQ